MLKKLSSLTLLWVSIASQNSVAAGLSHGKECQDGVYIASLDDCTTNAPGDSHSGDNTDAPEALAPPQQDLSVSAKRDANEYNDLLSKLKNLHEFDGTQLENKVYPNDANGKPDLAAPATPELNLGDFFGNNRGRGGLPMSEYFNAAQNEMGSPTPLGSIPSACTPLQKGELTFVRPSDVNAQGAVLFGGQSCAGVKRTKEGSGYQHNSWPSASVNGEASMTQDGGSRGSSANYKKGAYGDPNDPSLRPVWLGDSGAVQIHSLNRLQGDASLAGVSSKGCLVVSQNCMKAINEFLSSNPGAKFSIVDDNNQCASSVAGG